MKTMLIFGLSFGLLLSAPAYAQDTTVEITPADEIVTGLTATKRSLSARSLGVNLNVEFDYDSSVLTDAGKQQLAQLAIAFQSDRLLETRFRVVGHTDAKGNADYNMQLSQKRAAAVIEYLSATHGIDLTRMVSEGMGETQLLMEDDPENGRNRRVEIVALTN